MDLLSGVRTEPPAGIFKPNNLAIIGLVRGLTDIENRFGITFVNYLELALPVLNEVSSLVKISIVFPIFWL